MLECQKDAFSLAPTIHYLNCAYMSPLAKRVELAGITALQGKRNPIEIHPDDFFRIPARVRTSFARLIHAEHANSISIIPAVSYGIATVAKNIQARSGQNIVLVEDQFPSNVYSWMSLAKEKQLEIRFASSGGASLDKGSAWTDAIVAAIDSRTAVVSIPTVHWTDGTPFDLIRIREAASKVGAAFVLDGTQSVGALPIDVSLVQPDALVVAGYKWMMGPYSIGLVYWGDRFFHGTPIEENWINRRGSENFARLVDYEEGYQEGAIRFDSGGRSNFILLPMLEEAMDMIEEWRPDRVQQYLSSLIAPVEDRIQALGFGMASASSRASHLFGLRLPTHTNPETVKEKLASHSVYVSVRGNAVRVAPHVYNNHHDMEALVDALSAC